MRLFPFLNKRKQLDPIKEIVQAIRVLEKNRKASILVIEKSRFNSKPITAQEIVDQVLFSPRGAVRLNFREIKAINCLLPFPERLCQKELSDQELGCLGLSQHSQGVVVSISSSGELTISYQNSIRRLVNLQQLNSILETLFSQKKKISPPIKQLTVKKA